jgi:hypothetical protein
MVAIVAALLWRASALPLLGKWPYFPTRVTGAFIRAGGASGYAAIVGRAMSAIGTKRTSLVAPHMSAFGCKADMPFCTANVRL